MKPIIAQHWMLDAWDVTPARLERPDRLVAFCGNLVGALDVQVLGQPSVYRVDNKGVIWERLGYRHESKIGQGAINDKAWGPGVTILVGILDSSITLHTLSQFGRFYLDIFSCKPLPHNTMKELVRNYFGLRGWPRRNYKTRLLRRG